MNWIIVTGDSRGVGKEIVKQLLDETEFGVIGISRTSEESAKEFKEKYPTRFVPISYDLTDVEGIKALYMEKIRKIGPIYGLVNNSAMAYDDIISNLQLDQLQSMFQVNVFATMHLSKYAIRDMLLHKTKGSIVNISSVSAHTGYKGLSMYAASKAAIEAFSKTLAREWGSKGIRSNCVVPGFMETAISANLTEDQKERIYQRTSLKKETDISSVASTVLFLLSDKAKSITGAVVHVDNGTI
ncbi:3-oxoacyl-[acyl-carrier-protein] reductase OS=Ureibacillus acetophenoni OX=614649 GN=SAMN05877842_101438 PE=3 SV=1 [Ureibacillus acetophenoni]